MQPAIMLAFRVICAAAALCCFAVCASADTFNLNLSFPTLGSAPPFEQLTTTAVSNGTQSGIQFQVSSLVPGTQVEDLLFNVRDASNSFTPLMVTNTTDVFASFPCNCAFLTSQFGFFDFRVTSNFQAGPMIFSVFAANGITNLGLANILVPGSGGSNPQFFEGTLFFPNVPSTVTVAGSSVAPVPEPNSLLMLVTGLVALYGGKTTHRVSFTRFSRHSPLQPKRIRPDCFFQLL